ncbi:MAG: hypothetical protein WCP20_14805 [Desulfuromonadales bacterium]
MCDSIIWLFNMAGILERKLLVRASAGPDRDGKHNCLEIEVIARETNLLQFRLQGGIYLRLTS